MSILWLDRPLDIWCCYQSCQSTLLLSLVMKTEKKDETGAQPPRTTESGTRTCQLVDGCRASLDWIGEQAHSQAFCWSTLSRSARAPFPSLIVTSTAMDGCIHCGRPLLNLHPRPPFDISWQAKHNPSTSQRNFQAFLSSPSLSLLLVHCPSLGICNPQSASLLGH